VCHDFQQDNPGATISKLNFSALFAKLWLQALTPANIMAGFKKCGVHPFNRKAIPVPDPDDSSTGVEATEQSSSMTEEAVSEVDDGTTWSEELFERRYEEGYDLYDPDYLSWLELHYPDADHYILMCGTKHVCG